MINKIKNMNPLQKLQEKIGVNPDGIFGPKTIKAAAKYFNMSAERAAHFFGQTSHESGNFTVFVENMNYSAKRLKEVFSKYFPNNLADSYARNPVKIGSRVYANRMGNGNEASQEGYKYRGRGALQTTGKYNYTLLSNFLKRPEIMDNPDLVSTDYAFESALFFFDNNKLWSITDKGVTSKTITDLTKKINGGTNGLNDRVKLTLKYYKWLKS